MTASQELNKDYNTRRAKADGECPEGLSPAQRAMGNEDMLEAG